MPLALRSTRDPFPGFSPLDGLVIRPELDADVMSALQHRSADEMHSRFGEGHRAYVAWLHDTPAAFGWIATRQARIGEIDSTFVIPERERYLWNFVTQPTHRGLGIYPRLLDAMVRAESWKVERFWVAYAPENHASGTGIRKAGFTTLAALSFDVDGRPAVRDVLPGGARSAARFLGIRETVDELAPCWRCAKQMSPLAASCHGGSCACDYQRAQLACAG
ncbi:MAG: GNAT family N-acetyltransferase [bacterium]